MSNRRRAVLRRIALALVLVSPPLGTLPVAVQQPSLDEALGRARQVVSRYVSEAALLLADEQCDQRVSERVIDPGGGSMDQPRGRRRWQAEIALVPTPDLSATGYPWIEFRDVVVVDGHPVPDRQERLSQLFLKEKALSMERAGAIVRQGARFNMGGDRTLNMPSVPLLILHPVNQHRFAFSRMGEATMDDVMVWKVGFQERASPTLIKAAKMECAAMGAFWIAPTTGEVLQADLQCTTSSNRITVKYRPQERLRLRLPAEMLERPANSAGGIGITTVEGRCRYSNYRRFETGARLILPPKWPQGPAD